MVSGAEKTDERIIRHGTEFHISRSREESAREHLAYIK